MARRLSLASRPQSPGFSSWPGFYDERLRRLALAAANRQTRAPLAPAHRWLAAGILTVVRNRPRSADTFCVAAGADNDIVRLNPSEAAATAVRYGVRDWERDADASACRVTSGVGGRRRPRRHRLSEATGRARFREVVDDRIIGSDVGLNLRLMNRRRLRVCRRHHLPCCKYRSAVGWNISTRYLTRSSNQEITSAIWLRQAAEHLCYRLRHSNSYYCFLALARPRRSLASGQAVVDDLVGHSIVVLFRLDRSFFRR